MNIRLVNMLGLQGAISFSIALVQLTYDANGGGFVQVVVNERDASFFWASKGECNVVPLLLVSKLASRYRWALTRNNHKRIHDVIWQEGHFPRAGFSTREVLNTFHLDQSVVCILPASAKSAKTAGKITHKLIRSTQLLLLTVNLQFCEDRSESS